MFLCKLIGPGWFLPSATAAFGVTLLTVCKPCTLEGFPLELLRLQCSLELHTICRGKPLCWAGYRGYEVTIIHRRYRKSELTFRIAIFMVTVPKPGASDGLLASTILSLDHFGSLNREVSNTGV